MNFGCRKGGDWWPAPRRPVLWVMLLVLLTPGCSSFRSQWKRAAEIPPSADSITGRWEGVWRSEVNQHQGRLRCLITPAGPGQYTARYHAKYRLGFLPLSFGYTVPLTVQSNAGAFAFQSEANLGWYAGGTYRYRGTATATNFISTYDSKYDRGLFEMSRPSE